MKQRDQKIVRAILEALDLADGLLIDTILHAEVNLRVTPNALLAEFDKGIAFCESKRWITGIRPEVGSTKWMITELGQAKKAEMQ